RGGHTIIVTLMKAPPDFWPQAKALLNWGFAAVGHVTPVGTLVGPEQPSQAHAQVRARPVVAVAASRGGAHDVPIWEIATLAASTAVLVTVCTRRLRRRRG